MSSQPTPTLEQLREKALELGWDDIGVTAARIPEADVRFYREWIAKNKHGDLDYLANDVRCEPDRFFPGAQSAILFVSYYRQEKVSYRNDKGIVASYARGLDYHNVHRRRLKKYIRWLEEFTGTDNVARGFSDSHPVMERALAAQAGLGWMGKNTLLIHRRFGTFFLLSGLMTTLELPYTKEEDTRFPRCGSCTRCLDACPTQALSPYQMDATKCLSYHLIESKKPIPEEIKEKNPGFIFGCDICQDVCPHNVRPPLSNAPDFDPDRGVGPYLGEEELTLIDLEEEALWITPLRRRGAEGLRENWSALKNKGQT